MFRKFAVNFRQYAKILMDFPHFSFLSGRILLDKPVKLSIVTLIKRTIFDLHLGLFMFILGLFNIKMSFSVDFCPFSSKNILAAIFHIRHHFDSNQLHSFKLFVAHTESESHCYPAPEGTAFPDIPKQFVFISILISFTYHCKHESTPIHNSHFMQKSCCIPFSQAISITSDSFWSTFSLIKVTDGFVHINQA